MTDLSSVGAVSRTLKDGILAERAQMPFWLQMVGTGLTTMFSVHLGAVLESARWPAIPCINIFSHHLLKEFKVESGQVKVPQAPGLGVELDGMRSSSSVSNPISRNRSHVRFTPFYGPTADKPTIRTADNRAVFLAGKLPPFLPGVSLERRLDDGSEAFDREYRERFPETN